MPVHIRAHPGDISDSVVAVGDPGRAKLLSSMLEDAVLVNDFRCLLTYTGNWKGKKITIATHGVGSGSAGIVFEELYQLGAKKIVRLGTAGGVTVEPGKVIVADSASAFPTGCGTGQYAPGIIPPLVPDIKLTMRIYESLNNAGFNPILGTVHCSDAFYAETQDLTTILQRLNVKAIEMELANLFLISRIRGFSSAGVVLVSNKLGSRDFLDTELMEEMFRRIAAIIFDII